MPTLKPIFDKLTAILAVMVDFPTPPLPEAIAIIFCIDGIFFPFIRFDFSSFFGAADVFTFTFTSIFSSTFKRIAFLISTSTFFFACNVGLLMVTSIITSLPNTTRLLTFLFSTRLFPSPGSVIVSSALSISCFVKDMYFYNLCYTTKIMLKL